MFFEVQHKRLCGLHALNNGIGGHTFDTEGMDRAIEAVLEESKVFAVHADITTEDRPSNQCDPSGDYSDQAIAMALKQSGRWVLDQTPLHAQPRGIDRIFDSDVKCGLVHVPGHWFAVKVVDDTLWSLDSLAAGPVVIGKKGKEVSTRWLKGHKSVFVIRRTSGFGEGELATGSGDRQQEGGDPQLQPL